MVRLFYGNFAFIQYDEMIQVISYRTLHPFVSSTLYAKCIESFSLYFPSSCKGFEYFFRRNSLECRTAGNMSFIEFELMYTSIICNEDNSRFGSISSQTLIWKYPFSVRTYYFHSTLIITCLDTFPFLIIWCPPIPDFA